MQVIAYSWTQRKPKSYGVRHPDVKMSPHPDRFASTVLLIYSAKKYDHMTPLLWELHWLRIPERIQFRLCVLAYRCLTGTAPQYLADTLSLSTNVADRCRLRSADSQMLQLPSTRRTTLGDQAFSVTAARQFAAWDMKFDSLLTFRRTTKTHSFHLSFC